MGSKPLRIAVITLFLLTVFSLAVAKIEDTDAWMHLVLGKLIWQQKGLPAENPHLFTAVGMPFAYTSWLFGLLFYLSYALLNVYGVILLKAVAATALFAVLLADSLRPRRNLAVAVVILGLTAVVVRYRFIERPDLFSMLFLAFTIFSLRAYRSGSRNFLFALPAVHLVWANMHSSIGLLTIPFLAQIGGAFLERWVRRPGADPAGQWSPRQIATMGAVMLASLGASLLNPNGSSQYVMGARYLESPFFKQLLAEFQPLTWPTPLWPFLAAAVLFLSFLANRRRFSDADLLLSVPFLLLPFVAIRFMFFLGIVAGPVISRNLSAWIEERPSWKAASERPLALAAAAAVTVLCGGLAIANVLTVAGETRSAGFGIETARVPEGALRFMDREGVYGRVFNLFQWGGYIAWRDYPRRTVFVDPRGVVPPERLEDLMRGQFHPDPPLDALADRYRIDAILIPMPSVLLPDKHLSGQGNGVSESAWALVYWDDISRLYLKRGGPHDRVVRAREYRRLQPERQLPSLTLLPKEHLAQMLQEARRAAGETGATRANLVLGSLEAREGRHAEAITAYRAALRGPTADRAGILGEIGRAQEHLGLTGDALAAYEESISIDPRPAVLHRAGLVYLDRGDLRGAVRCFERALEGDPRMAEVFKPLAAAYQKLGRGNDVRKLQDRYQKAVEGAPGNADFRLGLQAYAAKEYQGAITAFSRSLDANPGNAAAYSNIGYVYYETGDMENALRYQRKAIEVNAGYANAYYGLALVMKRHRDPDSAMQAWREYLRLEPAGYYAERARQEIDALGGRR